MASELETLVIGLEANIKKFETEMNRASGIVRQEMGKASRSAAEARKKIQSSLSFNNLGRSSGLDVLINQFGTLAAAAGVSFGTAELISYADQWKNLGNRLAAYGVEADKVNATQNEIAAIAQRAGASFNGVATAYTRILGASRDLGASQRDVAIATETVSKALVLNGSTTAEVESLMVQLGQALGKGVVNGDELNSILEAGRPIAVALADSLGVPVGALKELGAEGKISSQQLFQAILQANSNIEASYAKTSRTVSQAFSNLQTSIIAYIGNADSATGATGNLVVVLDYLAKNVDKVATAMLLAGGALAAAFTAKGVGAVIQLGQAIFTVFTAVTPLGRAIRLATAAIAGLVAIGSSAGLSLQDVADAVTYVGDAAGVVSDAITGTLAPAFDYVQAIAAEALASIADAFGLTGLSAEDFGSFLKTVINSAVDTVVKGGEAIGNALGSIPSLLMGSVVSSVRVLTAAVEAAINDVIASIRDFVTMINDTFAMLPDSLGGQSIRIPLPDFVSLGNVSGDGFGEAFSAAAKKQMEIFSRQTPDYLGDLDKAVRERSRERQRQANMTSAISAREPADRVAGAPAAAAPRPVAPDRTKELSDADRAVQSLNDEVAALNAKRQALDLVTTTGNAANIQQEELARLIQSGVKNTEDYVGATAQLATEQERLNALQNMRSEFGAVEAETRQLQAQAQAMQLATGSGVAYEAQVRLITAALLAKGAVTQADIERTRQMGLAYEAAAQKIQAAQEKQEAAAQAAADYDQLINGFANNFADGFMSVVDGSMSAKDAFKLMVADMVKGLIRLGVQMAALAAIGATLKALGLEDFVTQGLKLINTSIPGRAAGGSVRGGSPYIVGEKGPELFLPGKSGTIIPNNVLAKARSGGGSKVTVNNYSGAQVDVQNRRSGDGDIIDIVVRRVGAEMSSGRFDSVMGSRYGTTPVMKRR